MGGGPRLAINGQWGRFGEGEGLLLFWCGTRIFSPQRPQGDVMLYGEDVRVIDQRVYEMRTRTKQR